MEPAPHGRATRALVAVSATLSLLTSVLAGVAIQTIESAADVGTVCFNGGPPPCPPPVEDGPVGPCAEDVCNYLILGSDSRRGLSPEEQERFGTDRDIGGENRTDTIMLVHTDPSREKAVVLTFPRDLWVEIPGRGLGKINGAFEGGIADGGPGRMASTIHRLTGLEVNHYLYVDLAGFQGIVDELGGVELYIPTRLDDPLTDLHLDPGPQVLSGHDALGFVRTRHLPCDERNPDFARIGRQQQFLRALINRMLQPGQLARAPGLVRPILGNLRRDPELKIPDLAYLVGQLQGVDTGAVAFRAVPGTPELIHPAGYPNGLAIVRMDRAAERLFEAIRLGRQLPPVGAELQGVPTTPANITVPVVDAGSERATDVLEVLSLSGFDISEGVVSGTRIDVPLRRSGIVFGPEDLVPAKVVQQFLPQLDLVEEEGYTGVAVVVSDDYRPAEPGSEASVTDGCIEV
jgi:LCP family protein required for cell wall assembly